jgi:tRNA-splicing ligase RtcB
MPVRQIIERDNGVHVKIWTNDVEPDAIEQLKQTAALPFVHHHIAAMADCHWGMGSTVGSVIATERAIIPAAVGVDIGCGMIAQKLTLRAEHLPDNLHALRSDIESRIPHGRTDDGGANDRGAWGELPEEVSDAWYRLSYDDPRWLRLSGRHESIFARRTNTGRHLGTLGTGNHFIELCLDREGWCWLMLHSGSRGVGNRIGSYFISLAKKQMEKYFIHLPNQDLAYLVDDTDEYRDYLEAVSWAQDFAKANREIMMARAMESVSVVLGREFTISAAAVNCHHNYVAREKHFGKTVNVTRKGAVRAGIGDLGIIPGSMGARSFIVRGLGNPESFCSCSHGAGRKMGRNAAKKLFTVADLEAQTAGVECRKDADVIDEIPAAYKDIQTVMDNQSDLVEIVAELKQVVCIKG